jgi:hypothetical protein
MQQSQVQWVADRAQLRKLKMDHPAWSIAQLVEATQHSRNWVKKWLKRFKHSSADDETLLWGLPPLPKTPRTPMHPLIVERVIEIRHNPPDNLKRIPGPKTIAYFLQKDKVLLEHGLTPPRSPSTIWRILVKSGCIARPGLSSHEPLERSAPLECIAIDFKDASIEQVEPDGKKQHLVEVLNFVDEGTSVLWEAVVRSDFNAETVVETLLEVFQRQGLPPNLRFDRDTRFVGSSQSRDFPSAMVRMLHVLGIQPHISPPHRPDKNPFVERYNGSYKRECLQVHNPEDLGQVKEVTVEYKDHYNYERPHQGRSCKNQPPRIAFAELPILRGLPLSVDPDSWLRAVANEHFTRKVKSDGAIGVDKRDYYVGRELAGQYVVIKVDAEQRELAIEHHKKEVKRLAIKGLYRREMILEDYRQAILEEARSEKRGWQARRGTTS